jgi:two-component system OmpR family response regulator
MPAQAALQSRILVVEDDPDVAELIAGHLRAHGFAVDVRCNAAAARHALNQQKPDLLVLDLGLPDGDGLELTRELAAQGGCAILIVSARGDAIDRVVGLELGADDYLAKPFEPRELVARARSLLRRQAGPASSGETSRVAFDRFQLDLQARRLFAEAGEEIAITQGEFELLAALLERPRCVLSRNELMRRLHGRCAGPFDRAIDVQVSRLRRKLRVLENGDRLIRSVRGGGYLLDASVRDLGSPRGRDAG